MYLLNLKEEFKFIEFGKQASIESIIELMVFVYAKKYAIELWYSFFRDFEKDLNPVYPKDLDADTDLYLSMDEITNNNIKSFGVKQFDVPEHNTTYVEWMRLEFTNPQQLNLMVQAIIKGLQDMAFTQNEEGNTLTFIVEDSPISKIEVTSISFRMEFNPDKWIAYYGM